jgi:hypothetical protein
VTGSALHISCFTHGIHLTRSWCSSVSIESDNTLDDRETRVRSSAEVKDSFSRLCVQTSSEVHPASYPMGTVGPFPGGKTRPGVTLNTHPHLVPRSRMSRSYTFSPLYRLHAGSRTALLYPFDSRLGGPQILSGCGTQDKIPLTMPRIEPRPSNP